MHWLSWWHNAAGQPLVGCPMAGGKMQLREFARWPHYKRLYIRAFTEMVNRRIEAVQGSNQNREVLESPGFSRGEDVNSSANAQVSGTA
ncbi:MAG: hypothetical protein Q8O71_01130 [bacterium]|nr:hypothetical protein [bacterium]